MGWGNDVHVNLHTHVMPRYCYVLLHLHTHVMLRYGDLLLHLLTHVMLRYGKIFGTIDTSPISRRTLQGRQSNEALLRRREKSAASQKNTNLCQKTK